MPIKALHRVHFCRIVSALCMFIIAHRTFSKRDGLIPLRCESQEILYEWLGAGAHYGHFWPPYMYGERVFLSLPLLVLPESKKLPGFSIDQPKAEVLRLLPEPGEDFALIISDANGEVTRELQRFSKLRYLVLQTQSHEAILTEKEILQLSRIRSLIGLSLSSARLTQQTIAESLATLGALERLQYLSLPDLPAELYKDVDKLVGHIVQGARQLRQLRISSVSDEGVRQLRQLSHLQDLTLSSGIDSQGRPVLTDRGLVHLLGLKNLQRLEFRFSYVSGCGKHYETGITTEGAKTLGHVGTLRALGLAATQITEDALQHLQHLPLLHIELPVHHERFRLTERVLRALSNMKGITHLDFMLNIVSSDEALKGLAQANQLESLYFWFCDITGVGFRYLVGLPNLKRLQLVDCPINDEGVYEISKLKSLQELFIVEAESMATSITDCSIPYLLNLTSLRKVGLHFVDHGNVGDSILLLTELPHLNSLQYSGDALSPRTRKQMNDILDKRTRTPKLDKP